MTTLKERAQVAAATLQSTLQIAPDNYDADQTAAIVELALKNAARERDSLARHRLREAQTASIGMSAETEPPAIPVTKVRPRTIRIGGEWTM